MQAGNILCQIRASYQKFTKSERKVADFIFDHAPEVLLMSINDLADACEVGETTVFRFCKTMKLQGYQEFKIQLSLSTQDKNKYNIIEGISGNVEPEDSLEIVSQKLLNSNISVLRETSELINFEAMDTLLDKMITAERIFFFGVGASQIMAMMTTNKFLRVSNKVYCYTDSHMQTMEASMLSPRDVAIIISYSGSTKDSMLIAKLAKKSGAYVAGVTRFANSPLASQSDVVLLCGANEGPLQGGSTTAVMSQLFLMEVLYTEYYRKTYDISYQNNQKTSQSITDKMY